MTQPRLRGTDLLRGLLALMAALLMATPGLAQVLEEITVTAQKREQALSDVGISVTAFSGDQLKELGFTSTQQIDEQVPGLMVTDYGSGVTTVFTIRGSGQLDFADQQEPPVAVYLDGAYNSYLAGVGFNFFDVERIEVLRGSQGTLFGRNATGGLVHVISNKPTREFEGYGELSAGERDKVRFEGAVSGPLGEWFSGRLSLAYENDDGYMEDRGPNKDTADINDFSARTQLMFEPNEDLSVLLALRYSTDDTNGQFYHIRPTVTDVGGVAGLPGEGEILFVTPQQHFDWCTNVAPAVFGLIVSPVLGGTNCAGFIEPDDGPWKGETNTQSFYRRDVAAATTTIEWDLGWAQLTSITDWQDFRKDYLEDTDSSPVQLFDFFQNFDSNQLSQEVRLAGESAPFRWVVGAYYLNIDSSYQVGVDGRGAFGLLIDNRYQLETTTYAFFGQGEWDFQKDWTLIAGIRWTEDMKRYAFQPNICTLTAFGLPCPPNRLFASFVLPGQVGGDGLSSQRRTEGDWSGHVELDWHPNDDLLVYGKVSRGHKAGGFNGGGTAFFTADQATYDSELPVTYEGGFKATLFNGKARLNASGFYVDYKDFQTFTQLGLSLLIFNIDAEVLGTEIELVTNPWEGWEFLFGLSLLDADQQDLDGPGGVKDRPMPNAPDVSFNGLGRYEWPMFDGMMAVQIDMNYNDERSLNAIDHEALVADDYLVANGKIGWTSSDDHWHAELWVKNFTNEEYIATLFDLSTIDGSNIEVPGPPRWFGGTVRYSW